MSNEPRCRGWKRSKKQRDFRESRKPSGGSDKRVRIRVDPKTFCPRREREDESSHDAGHFVAIHLQTAQSVSALAARGAGEERRGSGGSKVEKEDKRTSTMGFSTLIFCSWGIDMAGVNKRVRAREGDARGE